MAIAGKLGVKDEEKKNQEKKKLKHKTQHEMGTLLRVVRYHWQGKLTLGLSCL